MSSLRILIVDDHEAVRTGIRSVLAARGDWVVCGEAADGLEAVEKAKELRPGVVLMDITQTWCARQKTAHRSSPSKPRKRKNCRAH